MKNIDSISERNNIIAKFEEMKSEKIRELNTLNLMFPIIESFDGKQISKRITTKLEKTFGDKFHYFIDYSGSPFVQVSEIRKPPVRIVLSGYKENIVNIKNLSAKKIQLEKEIEDISAILSDKDNRLTKMIELANKLRSVVTEFNNCNEYGFWNVREVMGLSKSFFV